MKFIISIHDIFPQSLKQTASIVDFADRHGLGPLILLISPGFAWKAGEVEVLQKLCARGHIPAGHGWDHDIQGFKGFYHRLHGLILSRRQAEHLALEPGELKAMIGKCYSWFSRHKLPAPDLYVPPAWAMGRLTRQDLQKLPFRWYETLTGIYDSHRDIFYNLPLMGFQADTALRKVFLNIFNRSSLAAGGILSRPVRVALHPFDFQLRLGNFLRDMLSGRGLIPLSRIETPSFDQLFCSSRQG
ncbi:MAG: polysaccharide deacetylase family protein [Desulfonatronovibrionaceae bacterium]